MGATPKDIAFNNASKNRDHNIFTEEYYGGADTYIYIGGERYDNISGVQFAIREQQKPIYGYSSRVYDSLATGVRIVQGAIKVPVKNEGPVDRASRAAQKRANQDNEVQAGKEYNVPDWVYKYSPDKQDIGTPNEEYNINNKDKSIIADVQDKLVKHGINLDITGIIDNSTKFAIAKYKKDMNLVVNNKCDLELENRMDIHGGDYMYKARGDIKLRFSPTSTSPSSLIIKRDEQVVVQGIVDSNWFQIQNHLGRKGYVRKTEVIKL